MLSASRLLWKASKLQSVLSSKSLAEQCQEGLRRSGAVFKSPRIPAVGILPFSSISHWQSTGLHPDAFSAGFSPCQICTQPRYQVARIPTFMARQYSTIPDLEQHEKPPDGAPEATKKLVLYRGFGMIPFRVLVRLKIFQLMGVASLAIPINTFLVQGSVSAVQAVMAGALVTGSAVASVTLWYYSRRYVGELSLVRRPGEGHARLCFSVLDFWGNREDNFVELDRMIPPLKGSSDSELFQVATQSLLPIDVEGDRQYFMSLRHGHIVNREALLTVFRGQMPEKL